MSRNTEIEIKQENPKFPMNLFLLLPNPFNRKRSVEVVIEKNLTDQQQQPPPQQPDVVRLSDPRPAVPPPLKLEAEEAGSTSNQIILWQVSGLILCLL